MYLCNFFAGLKEATPLISTGDNRFEKHTYKEVQHRMFIITR